MIDLHQAGFVNFLRTIFWILLIYYCLKIVMRYLTPFFLKKILNKVFQKAQEKQANSADKNQPKQGETVIDKKPTNSTINSKYDTEGEYVDFEEID